ncbi:hypothetical protein H4R19_003341 [Coemansia spiralis]|nr:hypothetical protein H4R19_003341 [Coemansia spiralis]
MPRPSSARGASPTVSHSWRQQLPPRPSARTVRHWAEATHDPSEADAESDSEGGLFGTPLLAPQHSRRSPLHRHRRQSSGQPGEWHAVTAHTRGRHRSDTGDSLRSNSSETCVSSGNRLSREFPSISSSLLLADHYDSRTHTAECPSDALPRHPHYGSHYDGGYSHLRSVEGRFMSPAPQPGRIRSSTHGGEISPVAHDYGPEPPLRPTAGPHLGHQRMEAATATPLPPDAPESSSGRRSPSVSLARKEELAQSGDSGLLSMFSLVYWTVLFTLGALMLDSFLCLTAGKRVMGTVDRITHTETANAPRGDQQADEDGSVDLAGAVGRFVRWYVECPEDTPSTGAQWPRPRSLRARKTLAARGSFQHIE